MSSIRGIHRFANERDFTCVFCNVRSEDNIGSTS